MRKITALLVTGVIMGTTAISSGLPALAKDADIPENLCGSCVPSVNYAVASENSNMNFIYHVDKKDPIKIEKEFQEIYDQIDKIEIQIDAIFDEAFKEFDGKYEKAYVENEDLWNKFYESLPESYFEINEEEYIKNSNVLTKEEKNILLEDLEKIEALNLEFERCYEKAESESSELAEKLNTLYDVLYRMNDNNRIIWDKVLY